MSNPLDHPQAEALLKNREALQRLVGSPEGRRLVELMSSAGDLQQAADRAQKGDPSQLMAQLSALMQTKEGARIVDAMQRKLSQK